MMASEERELRIDSLYNKLDTASMIVFSQDDIPQEAGVPTLDADAYVESLHVDGFENPRLALSRAIRRTSGGERFFFSGMRGSGKSTELRKLKSELENKGQAVVFYADMSAYLPLNTSVQIGDFLLVMLSALADEVYERYGESFKSRGVAERFMEFLKQEVQLEGLEWGVDTLIGKLGFKAKVKDNPSFKAAIQRATVSPIDKIVAQSRLFVDEVVAFVKEQAGAKKQVVFIVDSVERLQGIGSEAKAVFDSIENLFNTHRDKLRFGAMSVVYSVPPYISAATTAGDAAHIFTLPMIHVFEKPVDGQHGVVSEDGVRRMLSVIDQREPFWRDLIQEPDMRRMIEKSGGDLRELFQLVRSVLLLVDPDDDSHFPVPLAAIEHAEKKRRTQFGFIAAEEMDWLKRVVTTHRHGLERREQLSTLAALLDGKLIYQYRNGDNWYDVHPLLWDQVDKHGLGSASA